MNLEISKNSGRHNGEIENEEKAKITLKCGGMSWGPLISMEVVGMQSNSMTYFLNKMRNKKAYGFKEESRRRKRWREGGWEEGKKRTKEGRQARQDGGL